MSCCPAPTAPRQHSQPGLSLQVPCLPPASMMNNSYSDLSGLGLADEADEMPSTEKDLAEDAPWKKIQQNTFTRWCNEHLKCVGKRLTDLQRDLSDGLRLIALLEVLSQKRMYRKFHPRPNFRQMKLENVSVALEFLEREHIKLVSIGQCGLEGMVTAGAGTGRTGAGTESPDREGFPCHKTTGRVSPSPVQAAALDTLGTTGTPEKSPSEVFRSSASAALRTLLPTCSVSPFPSIGQPLHMLAKTELLSLLTPWGHLPLPPMKANGFPSSLPLGPNHLWGLRAPRPGRLVARSSTKTVCRGELPRLGSGLTRANGGQPQKPKKALSNGLGALTLDCPASVLQSLGRGTSACLSPVPTHLLAWDWLQLRVKLP